MSATYMYVYMYLGCAVPRLTSTKLHEAVAAITDHRILSSDSDLGWRTDSHGTRRSSLWVSTLPTLLNSVPSFTLNNPT